jgi:transposase
MAALFSIMARFNTCETKLDGLRNGGFLAHRCPQGAKMRQKSNSPPASSKTLVRNIRRATRKHHAAEEKIRIVLNGLRGETSIAELCRREGIAESMYYSLAARAPETSRECRPESRHNFFGIQF